MDTGERENKGINILPERKDVSILWRGEAVWSEHVDVTVNKASKLLGLFYRAVGSSNTSAFSTLYKSLVRPVPEYATPVWSPFLVKDVLTLEKVQRTSLALGKKRDEMEYEERLRRLKWSTLETRRLFLSLAECYKTVFDDLNKPNIDSLFEFTKRNSTLANHPYKLYDKPAKCNPYKYSSFIGIAQDCNSLTGSIVEAGSLSHFKSALKRFLDIH